MSLSRFLLTRAWLGVRQLKDYPKFVYACTYSAVSKPVQNPSVRCLYVGSASRQLEEAAAADQATTDATKNVRDSSADRTNTVPVETSIKYLQSEAYQTTYGENPVWMQYRRNHKGIFAPRKTRKTCIRKGTIATGNPCPICRDEYLLLDHRNTQLLRQFISPHNGNVLSYQKTGLCQKRHQELLVAVEKARDVGLIDYDVPFREYEYAQYYKT